MNIDIWWEKQKRPKYSFNLILGSYSNPWHASIKNEMNKDRYIITS